MAAKQRIRVDSSEELGLVDKTVYWWLNGVYDVELNELRSLFMKMGSKATRVPLEGGAGARISDGGVLGVFKGGKH